MKKDAVDRFLDPNSPERKRAEAAINAIDIANCTSVTDITLAVERTLNTRIKVIETDVLNGVELCGVWGKRDGYDIIYHAETNSETYKDQIVLHELAHMLLKHNPDPQHDQYSVAQVLFPDLDPSHFLMRARLDTHEELEAEGIADLLFSHLRRQRRMRDQFAEVFG